jgi:hypothetical protein
MYIPKHKNSMKCPKCHQALLWGGDNSHEDLGDEGEFIISNNTCDNDECNVDSVCIRTIHIEMEYSENN